MMQAKYQFRFEASTPGPNPNPWETTFGCTEREAADHIAMLVGSRCPVPGAFRRGKKSAVPAGPGRWRMPTGICIEVRERSAA